MYMKKKLMLIATTLLISSFCLYGCGDNKNTEDTVIDQTEVVDIQNQTGDGEGAVSSGDFATKNFEYNHAFDDIINEAPIIDTDFLYMTSDEQVMAKYGQTEYDGLGWIVYEIDNADLKGASIKVHPEDGSISTYRLNFEDFDTYMNNYMYAEGKWNIDENFSCDYIGISGQDSDSYGRYIDYLKDGNGNRLVYGHTYEEIAELFGNKGMIYKMQNNTICIVWFLKAQDGEGGRWTGLTFDPFTQQCTRIGF